MKSSRRAALALVHDAEEADAEGEEQGDARGPIVRKTAWRPLMGAPWSVTTCSPKMAMPSVLPLTAHW